MTTAVLAEDLGANSVAVEHLFDRAFDLVVEAGPAAVAGEFILRAIERRIATPADVGAGFLQVGIFADERPLCPFSKDYPLFFGREPVELGVGRILAID